MSEKIKVLISKKFKDITEDDVVKFDIIFLRKPNGWYATLKNKLDQTLRDKSLVEIGKIKKDELFIVKEK